MLFGLPLPAATHPLPDAVARTLAQRLTAAANALTQETTAARAAMVRREAQDYLAARRSGAVQIVGAMRGRCDDAARVILQRTLPGKGGELLVAYAMPMPRDGYYGPPPPARLPPPHPRKSSPIPPAPHPTRNVSTSNTCRPAPVSSARSYQSGRTLPCCVRCAARAASFCAACAETSTT